MQNAFQKGCLWCHRKLHLARVGMTVTMVELEYSDSERNTTVFEQSYINSANPSSKLTFNCISLWINLQKGKD